MPRIAVALTLLLALTAAPMPAPAAAAARVLDLGWTTQDQAIKVVAHLDRAVRFRASASGDRLVVDLWPVSEAAIRELAVNTRGVGTVRQQQLEGGIARLSISLQGATRYKLYSRADPYKLAVVILQPWRATVPLPPSVSYRRLRVRTGRGWTSAHAVLVDLANPHVTLRPALGSGTVAGPEPTAVAATRHDAFAAINGGFFAPRSGQPLGLVVIDGRLLSTPIGRRSVFAITAEGRPVIQPFTFHGSVESDIGAKIPISAVNRPPRRGGLAVYTPEYGPLTPAHVLHAVVIAGTVTAFPSGRVAIPEDGYVLSALAAERDLISRHLVLGQQVRLDLAISPGKIVHAIGGGPRLVQDGEVFVPFRWESFGPAFSSRRTSRSAIGITAAGKVLLVTIEKSRRSTGMRLIELARLMRELGAVQAMNLDGGGSSTLVVGGRVVNVLERHQRGVPSMLLVVPRPSE